MMKQLEPDKCCQNGVEEDLSCMQTAADMPMQTYRAGEAVPKPFPEAPEMVAIPPGSFLMGSPEDEPERLGCEGAQHEVRIGTWLAVGKYAVTREEIVRFAQETQRDMKGAYIWTVSEWTHDAQGSWREPGFDQSQSDPAVCISWDDAQAYLQWLNNKAGLKADDPTRYRLLSEAEWEYACRAGTTTAFWWGNSISTDQANYDGTYSYNASPEGKYRLKTAPVDSFAPNPWGLYQMHGNVWEWVEDVWHDNYQGAPTDGKAWTEGGNQSRRVFRGGWWYGFPGFWRSAYRHYFTPSDRYDGGGFRIARTLP